MIQKRPAADADVIIGLVKVARVPRVCNIAVERSKAEELANLALRIIVDHSAQIADVVAVHAYQVVKLAVVGLCYLPCPMGDEGNIDLPQLGCRAVMGRISDLLAAGCRRIYHKSVTYALLLHHMGKNTLRHRTAAYIPVADEKYFYHNLYIPS